MAGRASSNTQTAAVHRSGVLSRGIHPKKNWLLSSGVLRDPGAAPRNAWLNTPPICDDNTVRMEQIVSFRIVSGGGVSNR